MVRSKLFARDDPGAPHTYGRLYRMTESILLKEPIMYQNQKPTRRSKRTILASIGCQAYYCVVSTA